MRIPMRTSNFSQGVSDATGITQLAEDVAPAVSLGLAERWFSPPLSKSYQNGPGMASWLRGVASVLDDASLSVTVSARIQIEVDSSTA